MDRRALFFLIAGAASGALVLVVEDDLDYVPRLVGVVYAVLAIVSWLDWRSNQRA
ncbi:MAG: hypothetical protein ACRDZ3_09700 [Acidimicrobiia bacterium]